MYIATSSMNKKPVAIARAVRADGINNAIIILYINVVLFI
jgi:hypothetical protein